MTITEDCETAFELHARGWHSVFVDKPLIAGLQPETFASFVGQRVRWCQGMLQISDAEESGLQERTETDSKARLFVEHDFLVLSFSAPHLYARATQLYFVQC